MEHGHLCKARLPVMNHNHIIGTEEKLILFHVFFSSFLLLLLLLSLLLPHYCSMHGPTSPRTLQSVHTEAVILFHGKGKFQGWMGRGGREQTRDRL